MPDKVLYGSDLDEVVYGSDLQSLIYGTLSTAKTWSVTTGTFTGTSTARAHETITAAEMNGAVVGLNVIYPNPLAPGVLYPIFFFQHGKGGSESLILTGGADAPAKRFDDYITAGGTPAIMVCVNSGDNSFGYDASPDAAEYGHFFEQFLVTSVIPFLVANYQADDSRIIGMGFSMGGTIMYRLSAKYPSLGFLGAAMFGSPMPSNWSGTGGFNTTDSATTDDYLGTSGGQALWEADNPRVNIDATWASHALPIGFQYYIRRGTSDSVPSQGATWPGSSASDNVKLLAESLGFTVDDATYSGVTHSATAYMAADAGNVFTWAEAVLVAAAALASPEWVSNQGQQQDSLRTIGGTAASFNADLMAAMQAQLSNDAGSVNELLIRWLQQKLSSTNPSLSGLMAEAAADGGVGNWAALQDLASIGA